MKSIILVALALAAVAVAAPPAETPQVKSYNFEQLPAGNYIFGFESDDGIQRNEKGVVKTVNNEENKPQEVVVVEGSYSYINPDGQTETIKYYADENGYRAEGPSIPQAPSRR